MHPAVAVYGTSCPLIVTWCFVTTAESTCKIRPRDIGMVFLGAGGAVGATWPNTTVERQQIADKESKYFFIIVILKWLVSGFKYFVKPYTILNLYTRFCKSGVKKNKAVT
jgi:hypothetical protein